MNSSLIKRRSPLWAACAAVRMPLAQRAVSGEAAARRSTSTRAGRAARMEQFERRVLMASPLTSVPQLHSLASAPAKLYLDFNGHAAIPDWLGISVPETPAFDRDGDARSFNSFELNQIREIWSRVAEKFSPFRIDVTTVDPGNRDNGKTAVMVFGGDSGDWLGSGVDGVAALGGFYTDGPNVGFTFTGGTVENNIGAGETAAHEAGHMFGLEHQRRYTKDGSKVEQEYSTGDQYIAPIMGYSDFAKRGLWWFGPNSPTNVVTNTSAEKPIIHQDDLSILSGPQNGFGYRADDFGDTQFSATVLKGINGTVSTKGVIHQRTDRDTFSFTAPAGQVRFTVNPAGYGGMLDASITLTDAFGTVLASADGASLSETITTNIASGTYFVTVSSEGNYGDIGQWELSGQLPVGVVTNEQETLLVSGTDAADIISITKDAEGYKLDVNGVVQTLDPDAVGQFNVLAGAGADTVTIGPGVTECYVLGGDGDDTLTGGDNNDTITGSGGNDLIFGGEGDDRLAGSAGRDRLVGGNGRDRMYGEKGNDVMTGGAGVDRLYGGDDNDVLSGESSADKLYGDYGNDTVHGGNGADLLNGGVGLDNLYGGADDDVLYARDQTYDIVNGGTGSDDAQVDDDDDVRQSLEELLA